MISCCAFRQRLGAVLLLLLGFAGGAKAQIISIAFDPPRELVLGPLDTLATPIIHKERRGLNVDIDLDTDNEAGFKLAYLPEGIPMFRRHRLSADSVLFGAASSAPVPSILRRYIGQSGLFTPSSVGLFNPYWFTAGGDLAYFPMALPNTGLYRYGWMQVDWVGERLLFHGWQVQERSSVADPVGQAPSVLPDYAPAAFRIRANDTGENGTTSDLEVAFKTTPMATGVSEYRIMLFPNRRTKDLSISDALAVSPLGYTVIAGSTVDPVFAFSSGLLDAELQPVLHDSTYRVVVLSMPDGSITTQPTLVLGSSIQLRLRAKAPSNIVLKDSLSIGGAASLFAAFDAPMDESTVGGYWCALEHGPERYWQEASDTFRAPMYIGLSAEDVFALPLERRFFIPAAGLSTYESFLPPGMKDHRGASVRSENTYRLVVASAPDSILSFFGFADHSPWFRYNAPTRQVQDLVADVDRNHEDGRLLRVRFKPALDTAGISAYRLYAATGTKTIAELMAIPEPGYVTVVPTGDTSYTVDWNGANDTEGLPVTVDRNYQVHVLSIGDTSTWNGKALYRRLGLLMGRTIWCRPSAPVVAWVGTDLNPSSIQVTQSLPFDSVGLQALRMALIPEGSPALSETDMATLPMGRFVDYPVDAHVWPLDTILPASMTDAFGATLLPGADYLVQTQFVPDGIDASVQPVSGPSASVTTVDTLVPVVNLVAIDSGITGTGRDILIRFDAPLSTSGLAAYRILVGPGADFITSSEADTALVGRYIDVAVGLPNYALRATDLLQIDGSVIGPEGTYRVTVYSMDTLGLAVYSRSTTIDLSDDDLRAQALIWTDVADFEDPRDVSVSFSDPVYGDSITGYDVVLLPASPSYSDAEIRGSAAVYRHPVASGAGTYSLELPASLPDRSGALMAFGESYQVAVLSTVSSSTGLRSVLNRSSLLPSLPAEWPVTALSANVLGDSIEVSFNAAPNESFLQDYRLIFSKTSDPLSLGEAFFVSGFGRTDLPLQGPGLQTFRLPRASRDRDGQLINDGVPRRVYLLSFAGSTSGALVESPSFLTVSVGLSPPAKSWLTLATGPEHWLLSADLPIDAVQIFDATGRLMHQAQPQDFQHHIQTAGWPIGSYLMRAQIEGNWQELRTALVR